MSTTLKHKRAGKQQENQDDYYIRQPILSRYELTNDMTKIINNRYLEILIQSSMNYSVQNMDSIQTTPENMASINVLKVF